MTTSATTADEALPHAWRRALTQEEIRSLLTMRDARSWLTITFNWAVIAAAFALVAFRPGIVTVVLAVFLIGGRMLGLAVLMHDASHRALLRARGVNDWVGSWLCAYPIWTDLHAYRPYHLQHHGKTGTAEDPDLGLVKPFPVTRRSLRRKMWRDLSGQTGRKFFKAAYRRSFGRWREDGDARRTAAGTLVTNLVLLAILAALGHPALYLLWVVAWFTTYPWVTRIRSIAEHALTPDPADPLRNTRTTIASPLERLFLAPNRVNYHLEHHLLMTVPHYNLPRMHALLAERGVLDQACVEHGYRRILRRAASRDDAATGGDEPTAFDSGEMNGFISPEPAARPRSRASEPR